MLKSIKDNKGVMDLVLSQIGLIIATAILLSVVFSVVFLNDWQRKNELMNVADGFSSMVKGMDTRFFEDTNLLKFPDKNYNYKISLSTQYIAINAHGNWGNELSLKEQFLVKPWPRENKSGWISGEDLHIYLNATYGCYGNESNPIKTKDIKVVQDELNNLRDIANKTYALKPFYVDINKTVFIDKIYIYYDSNGDTIWDKNIDEKQSFLVIYQI